MLSCFNGSQSSQRVKTSETPQVPAEKHLSLAIGTCDGVLPMQRASIRDICREATANGRFIRQPDANPFPIPNALNTILVAIQVVLSFAILSLASHTRSRWILLLSAISFAFMMQLGYGLAHEAAHSKLHTSKDLNEFLGMLLYALF